MAVPTSEQVTAVPGQDRRGSSYPRIDPPRRRVLSADRLADARVIFFSPSLILSPALSPIHPPPSSYRFSFSSSSTSTFSSLPFSLPCFTSPFSSSSSPSFLSPVPLLPAPYPLPPVLPPPTPHRISSAASSLRLACSIRWSPAVLLLGCVLLLEAEGRSSSNPPPASAIDLLHQLMTLN